MKEASSQRARPVEASDRAGRIARRRRAVVVLGGCAALAGAMLSFALPGLGGRGAAPAQSVRADERALASWGAEARWHRTFAVSASGSWNAVDAAAIPAQSLPDFASASSASLAAPRSDEVGSTRRADAGMALAPTSWGVSGAWLQPDEAQRPAGHADAQMAVAPPAPPVPRLPADQQRIAAFLAEKYRVAVADLQRFVHYAFKVGRETHVDPVLILAVMSVESSFNVRARSDRGAQGLMQVHTRVHTEKFRPFGGAHAAFEPLANIRVGARILREYLKRDGSPEAALKSYVGAALLPHDGGYGYKVLSERARIAAASKGLPIPKQPLGPPPDLQALEARAAQAAEAERAAAMPAGGGATAGAALGAAAAAAGASHAGDAIETPPAPTILPGEHGQPLSHDADSADSAGSPGIPSLPEGAAQL